MVFETPISFPTHEIVCEVIETFMVNSNRWEIFPGERLPLGLYL